jgi:hypothetical protein
LERKNNWYNLLWQTGDYSDWITVNESDIIPLVEPAKQFIETINL